MQSWPVNWTTLAQHYENVHNLSLDEMRARALNNEAQDVDGKEGATKIVNIDNFLTKIPGHENRKRKRSKTTGLECVEFNKEEHLELLLSMIVSNNLSFSLVDSKSFRRYVLFLREVVPLVNRFVLRRTLTKIYQEKTESMKDKFVGNTGRFSITIDEWNSSNNIDFLGITLHFYNNEFELKKYTIGFEMLNENLSYTGKVVFESLMKVLCDYGIQKKITAITRDNAGPINVMMKKFIDYSCPNTIDFHGDIRCVGHILNLATECILNYSFFKKTSTRKFLENISNNEDTSVVDRMKLLPDIIRAIITQLRFCHKAKNSFNKQVEARKELEGTRKGPKKVVKDNATRWLSTYGMIDRFIYFRPEITKVLRIIYSDADEDVHIPEYFQITDTDWQYLESLCEILEVFKSPTIKLQGSSYPTIQETIPMVDELLSDLDLLLSSEFVNRYSLIGCGVREAKNKLLEYYPIYDEKIEKLKPLYLVMVLDPRYKLHAFHQAEFSKNKIDSIKSYFYYVYSQYSCQFGSHMNQNPVKPTRASSPGRGRFHVKKQDALENLEHEIKRYLKEPLENDGMDPLVFYKARNVSFPVISRMARDYFAVSAMSAPAEALFSQMGDVISRKRNNLSPTTIRMIAILKSLGIIQDDEIPEESMSFEENGKSPDDLSEEGKSAETEVWLTIDDIEDDEEEVDISIAPLVFGD